MDFQCLHVYRSAACDCKFQDDNSIMSQLMWEVGRLQFQDFMNGKKDE